MIEITGVYVNAKTRIHCRCLKCGKKWDPFPDNLRRRGKCPKCSGYNRRTHDEFVEEMSIINPNIEVIEIFKKTTDHIKVRCSKCGHVWKPVGESLLHGTGCPKCWKKENSERFLMPSSVFIERVKQANPKVNVLGQYIGANEHIKCKCAVCNYEWAPLAESILQGTGCPKCAGNFKKTHIEFVKEIEQINPTIEIIGNYITAKDNIKCKCKICGHIWNPKANNLQQGQGCPLCAKKSRADKFALSQNEFISRLNEVNPRIQVLGHYETAKKRVHVKCNICEHEWNPLAWDILRGSGCPSCAHTSTSYTEQFILHTFRAILGKNKVLSRDHSIIGKELDIVIPDYKKAIEPGSWYWHKNKINKDKEKREQCESKDFSLITIYDSCHGDCIIATDNVFTYDYDLSLEKGNESLKALILDLCKEWKIDVRKDKINWDVISNIAYAKSRKISTEDFIQKVKKVNHKVTVTGIYKGYHKKIECLCKFCGREMMSSPHHLLEGKGCKKCAGVELKTHEQFLDEMRIKQPTVVVLGKYVNSSTKILVHCSKCGNEWNTKPSNLLSGYCCNKCANEKRAAKSRLTHEQFLAKMKERGNLNVLVTGRYYNAKTKIGCHCKKCGSTWNATPNSLLQGHGCKNCNGGSSKKVLCVTTGEIFNSVSEAKRKYNIKGTGIYQCCMGKQQTCYGKEWKYYY